MSGCHDVIRDVSKLYSSRIEDERAEHLEALADRLGSTTPTELVRLAIEALLEANPIQPEDLAAWRRKRAEVEATGVPPGLSLPESFPRRGNAAMRVTPRRGKSWRRGQDSNLRGETLCTRLRHVKKGA